MRFPVSSKLSTLTRPLLGLLAGLATVSTGLAQTPQPWPFAGGDLSNSHAVLSPAANINIPRQINSRTVSRLAVKWAFPTAGDVSATPTVEAGGLYVPDWAGKLYKINPSTGVQIWSRNLCDFNGTCGTAGQSISRTSPAIGRNVLVVGDAVAHPTLTNYGAVVFGISKANGAKVWSTVVNKSSRWASVLGSPVIYNNVAYVGTASWEEGVANLDASYKPVFRGNVTALNVDTGAIIWQFTTIPAGYSGGAVPGSSMAVWPQDNALLIGTGNNYSIPSTVSTCVGKAGQVQDAQRACLDPSDFVDSLLSLDLTTGRAKWARRVAGADTWTEACYTNKPNCPRPTGADADFAQNPILTALSNFTGKGDDRGGRSQGFLLGAGQKNSVFYAMNPKNGGMFWSAFVGTGGMEWGSTLNTADHDMFYFALYNPQRVSQTIIGRGGTQPMTWSGGAWGALDIRTGAKKWVVPTIGQDLKNNSLRADAPGCLTFTNRIIFAGSSSGVMVALNAATGLVYWTYNSRSTIVSCPAIYDETVYWGTGYARNGIGTNHALYAFAVPPS